MDPERLTVERWQRLEAIFSRASALPPASRLRFLEEQCGTDASLRGEIDRMLQFLDTERGRNASS